MRGLLYFLLVPVVAIPFCRSWRGPNAGRVRVGIIRVDGSAGPGVRRFPLRSTRADAATGAGMSKRQRDTALRVATIRRDLSERAVERPRPPTIQAGSEQFHLAQQLPAAVSA